MSNGIYLTLEQYKDKDLPITITINGHTYHSQFALATTQTTWFEMGKQHGMELGSENPYDAWYDNGYTKGYEAGYDAGIDHGIEKTLSRIDEARLMGYEQGRSDCREATLQRKLLQEHIMECRSLMKKMVNLLVPNSHNTAEITNFD